MAVQPLSRGTLTSDRLASGTPLRRRVPPTPRRLAQRRFMVTSTKWLLPLLALALLSLVALWPEMMRVQQEGRIAFRRVFGTVTDSATVIQPRYHGMDGRGRPYTLTADRAAQAGPERINLVNPKGDVALPGNDWMMVQGKAGVFMQHSNQLDLSGNVQLYRDDGVTMRSYAATVDMKAGAAASGNQTHAEGPFGQLDAQGFTLLGKGSAIQFQGPARLILNQARR